jgi:hypothetical protein
MQVNSVPSVAQNTTAVQQQSQLSRTKDVENDGDKDDIASKALTQKATAQTSSVKEEVSQKISETKAAEQVATRISANARGQIVGSIIDTQA